MVYILDECCGDGERKYRVLKSKNYQIQEVIELIGVIDLALKELRRSPRKNSVKEITDALEHVYGFVSVPKERKEYTIKNFKDLINTNAICVAAEIDAEITIWINMEKARAFISGHSVSRMYQKYISSSQMKLLKEWIEEM